MKKLITISMMLISTLTFSQTTINIEPPTNDAYIYAGNPNDNYGSSPNLAVGYAGGSEMRMLIKWDLSSLPSCINITNVQIRLYQTTTNSSITTDIYRINCSWNENSVTWNNQPCTIGWYGSQTFSSTSGIKYVPATNLVNDWLINGNNGVMFKINLGSSYQMFDSKEASGSDPRLIITYTTLTPPTANISGNTNICGGESTTLTASGGTSYLWSTGATTSSITVSPSANTQYCVTVTDANGCTDQTCVTVNVTPSVTPSVSVSASSTNICSGDNVTFTAIPTNGGSTPSYQWKLNGGNVGTNSSTYSNSNLFNGNQVNCVMTSNANCANPTTATSNTITINVTSNIQASISISVSPSNIINQGDNATFTATNTNSVPSPFYQWKLNNINVGTNSNIYSNSNLLNGDQIKCILSSSSSCVTGSPATSNTITMTITTGISDFDFNNEIKIYPNPVKNKLIVQFENFKNFEIKLVNVLGKEIYNQKISNEKTEINLSEYSKGIYFLIVDTEEGIFRKKIFVQ